MRFINRVVTTIHLENYNTTKPTDGAEAKSRWKRFSSFKGHLSSQILNEQHGLCGYTELIPSDYGLGTHLEHIKPKSKYPLETFSYKNLIVSSLSHTDSQRADLNKNKNFGGQYKNNEYDENSFLSCTRSDIANFFTYLNDGYIQPNRNLSDLETKQALYTIDTLNLNAIFLVNRRRQVIQNINDEIYDSLNQPALAKEIINYYTTPQNGLFPASFVTAIQQNSGI